MIRDFNTTCLATACGLAAFAGMTASVLADPTIQDIAPADAAFVVSIPNLSALHESFSDGSLGDMMKEPAVEKFVRVLTETIVAEIEQSMAESDLGFGADDLALPTGAVGFSLTFHPEYYSTPLFLMMADFGENQDTISEVIEAAIDKRVDSGVEMSEDDYHGVTIMHLTEHPPEPTAEELQWWDQMGQEYVPPDPTEEFYAWNGSTLLFATDEQQMLNALDAFDNKDVDSVGSTDKFADAMAHHPDNPPLWMYVNLAPIFEEFMPAPDDEMFMPSPISMLGGLGLQSVSTLSVSMQLDDGTSMMTNTFYLASDDPQGIFDLAGKSEQAFEPPAFVGADAVSVMTIAYDLPGLADIVEKIATDFATSFSQDQQQANMMVQQIMGIVRPAFESMGGQIISTSYAKQDADLGVVAANLFALPSDDVTVIQNLLNLGAGQGMMSGRDFEGGMIFDLAPQAALMAADIAFGVGHGYFFIGEQEQVENALRRLANPGAATLADEPEFQRATASLSPRAMGYSYLNGSAQLNMLTQLAETSLNNMNNPMWGEPDESTQRWMDVLEAVPQKELLEKYFSASVSEMQRTRDGFIMKSYMLSN
ncbi:MAG: hypothetical protein H6815_11270 [Phycisphaeraceae bacterium]|nr:hypothetical protein [Phycisphaerales bacterium]MCB9861017.1 hypothetical protein [Phycisphaeraceae bacterium]